MDKTQKKQVKRYVAWGCAAVMVLLLAVMPLLAKPEAEKEGPQASILSVQPQPRDITRRLVGGGMLESSETKELTIPAAVKLTGYLVGNGDVVSKGDPIAEVDKVSVMNAIVQIQETLDYLAKQMEAASDDTVSESITSGVNGTVKVIYAEGGDNVADVMLEHGAMAVLSLNDRMAVEISCRTELAAGDTVSVTFADGTETEGTVESNLDGVLVVTVEDKSYAQGEAVTVTTEDGDPIGSGELYIHSPWMAYGYSGTVFSVHVREGQKVYSGNTLFRLTDTGSTAEYAELIAQRREYEEMMGDLFRMYASGTLDAPCDGIVSGVDTDGAFLLEDSGTGLGPILAGIITASGSNDRAEPENQPEGGSGEGGEAPGGGENPAPEGGETPGSGETPGGGETPGEGEEPEEPAITYYRFLAKVTEVGEDGSVKVLQDAGTQFASFAELPPITEMPEMTIEATYSSLGKVSVGDVLQIIKDSAGTILQVSTVSSGGAGGMGGGMGDLSGLAGLAGFAGMGGYAGQANVFEPYSLETITVATVTSQETMLLDITVDEADILLLQVGQTAELLVTPLGGQSFEAVITRISNDGVNSGGKSKFTVTASTPKHEDMYPGMTAALLLSVDTVKQVMSLPVAALVEDGPRTLVYTGYDEETETLTGPVEVTTGISDGEYVEVSGLDAGTEIYYAYYDTLEQSLTPDSGLF